jgi:hypothetical protein
MTIIPQAKFDTITPSANTKPMVSTTVMTNKRKTSMTGKSLNKSLQQFEWKNVKEPKEQPRVPSANK